jgi:hypothetical protein
MRWTTQRVAVGLVAALWSVAESAAGQALPRARVTLPAFETTIVMDTLAVPYDVAAPVTDVFRSTVTVFRNLQIPIEVQDSARRLVGHLKMRRSGSLAGAHLSQYFNCGMGMTGPNADFYRLYIALLVLLDPKGADSTKMGIALIATGQDMQGSSKGPVKCGSLGSLEAKLARLIRQQVVVR